MARTMSDDTGDTVLQRKAQAQRKALGGGAVSMPRALGRGLSVAADALWGLALGATLVADETLRTERALTRIGEGRLLILLENDAGPCGLVALDRDIVTGVIEAQTLGKVTRFPTDDRPFTPTDAAMMAPLLDAALPRFASMLAGQPDMAHLQGYGFGALVDDVQSAGLALDAEHYQIAAFQISLSQDIRTGHVVFLFPEPPETADTARAPVTGKHEAVLKLVPARMQVVLTRIHIPLDKARALRPGDTLAISSQAMTSAALVVGGGHIVARGKLGQMNGLRAIRIGGEATSLHKPVALPAQAGQPAPPPRDVATNTSATFDFESSFDMALEELAADLPMVQTIDSV